MKDILRKYIKAQDKKLSFAIGEVSDLEEIGEGANALVFQGSLYGNVIAIKFLTNQTGTNKLKRFKAEYLNNQLLPYNDYIAKLISYEELTINDKIFPSIVMKKYDGPLKRKNDKTPTEHALKFFFNFLLKAIKFIHKHGIVHRDLKPENILIDGEQFVLGDFGIASYNPNMFKLKTQTKRGERLGNYLFSAPEQAEGKPAHRTMDIYALGQLCQWYVTGKTHRGTHRESITKYLPESIILDKVIDKCLTNNPDDRFQSIEEIEEFISQLLTNDRTEERYLLYSKLFNDALAETFPKALGKIIFSDNKKIINRLLNNILKRKFDNALWWTDGLGNGSFKFQKLDKDIWLMGHKEIKVKSIWAFYDLDLHRDLVLINTEAMPSFNLYHSSCEYEEAGLVDNEHYITRSEYDNNYAEIDGKTINLSNHEVVLRTRYLKPKDYIIASFGNNAILKVNDTFVRMFIDDIESGEEVTEVVFRNFVNSLHRSHI